MGDATVRTILLLAMVAACPTIAAAQIAPVRPGVQYYADAASALPFSPAVRVGDVVYLSGQIGQDAAGKLPAGMDAQAKLAMDNVAAAARRAGTSMDRVVKCTVMLKDMTQWAAFNTIYRGYFAAGHLPARSAFGATALAYDALVEVECIAAA